ncbi:MAG: hypothetical protein ACK5O1_04575 [Holosporales bacterium]
MNHPINCNGWTPERRHRQAEAIRRWQPWDHATGPATPAGKAAASQNARKHGLRSRQAREELKMVRGFLRDLHHM